MKKFEAYFVPDGYFEKSEAEILRRTSRIRTARRSFAAAAVAMAAALVLFVTAGGHRDVDSTYTAMTDSDLALIVAMDENDIFLTMNNQ